MDKHVHLRVKKTETLSVHQEAFPACDNVDLGCGVLHAASHLGRSKERPTRRDPKEKACDPEKGEESKPGTFPNPKEPSKKKWLCSMEDLGQFGSVWVYSIAGTSI